MFAGRENAVVAARRVSGSLVVVFFMGITMVFALWKVSCSHAWTTIAVCGLIRLVVAACALLVTGARHAPLGCFWNSHAQAGQSFCKSVSLLLPQCHTYYFHRFLHFHLQLLMFLRIFIAFFIYPNHHHLSERSSRRHLQCSVRHLHRRHLHLYHALLHHPYFHHPHLQKYTHIPHLQ